MRAGNLGHHPAGGHDRLEHDRAQPGAHPGPQRHLVGDLDECPLRAQQLGAGEPSADQHDLDRSGHRYVGQPLLASLVHPR